MSFESRLNKTASILRESEPTGDWGNVGDDITVGEVPCRIQASSGREYIDGKIRSDVTHLVFMESFVLLLGDKLMIDGVTYEIVPPIIDAGGAGHHLQVWVKEYA
nr:hypothetical protein [uncultured Sphaerochaeta sp.]